MTSIKHFGIPGFGSGILQPKLSRNFRVRFLDTDGNPLPYSEHLSKQVTTTDPIPVWTLRSRTSQWGTLVGQEEFTIVFEDDVQDLVASSLLKLQQELTFTVAIDYLDGNDTVIRTISLTTANVEKLLFDSLSYASKSAVSTFDAKYSTDISDNESDIALALNDLKSTTTMYNCRESDVLSIFVTINYTDVKFQFNNPNL